jgi:serine/threonine protein kinase
MKAKLTDFGWSNYLNKSNMKRMTMCGTPIYLAPELVNNYGHDHRVDIWCIGVLMFELLTGQPPWIGEDVPTLKYNISNMKIRWPKNMDPDAVDLLKKTLRYNPDERISLRNMLMHPFFTKYYPDAVNSLIKPDGKKQRIYVISRDNPNIYYTSFNNTYNNNIIYNSSSNSNIIYNSGNNDIIYPTTINEIPYIPPSNITTTSYPIPSLTLNTSYYDTSNNFNNFNNIINTVPDISSIPSISLNDYGYTDKTYNSLNIKEFLENQERIDELVRKTEKNDSRNKIIFQSSYPSYNYNISNTLPVLHHSSSVYKTQSPFYFSNNNSVYQPQVNKNIKYSLPITKYSIQPVKYKKPQIIYSSLTAKRNFEGDIYGKRQLNNLYNKYGLNFK